MSYELNRSAVITGCVNCFCLACETFLRNREEAASHIVTVSHCENLSAIPYSDKFNDQYIRKFKSGYFCEFCNKLMQTVMHVNLHLVEEHHKDNRGSKLLQAVGNEVIAFNNIVINERSWHGLADNMCCICVTEFEDEAHHKAETTHVLGLIRTKVKFGANNDIYRHVDDSNIQCMTCNKLLPINAMSKHFNETDHFSLYEKCKLTNNMEVKNTIEMNNFENAVDKYLLTREYSKNEIVSYPGKEDKHYSEFKEILDVKEHADDCNGGSECNGKTIIEKPVITHQNGEEFGHNKDSAFETSGFVYVESLGTDVIKGHSEESTQIKNEETNKQEVNKFELLKDPLVESITPHSEINASRVYSSYNSIHYKAFDRNAFCYICQANIPSSLKGMKEHVEGGKHNKNMLAKKQTMKDFIVTILQIQGNSNTRIESGHFMNDQNYKSLLSHLLLTRNSPESGLKCLICNVVLPPQEIVPDAHIDSCSLPNMKKMTIIPYKEDEFIRLIKPKSFHCGFCHVVVSGWEEMKNHLKSSEHSHQKSESYSHFRFLHNKLFVYNYAEIFRLPSQCK